MGSSPLAAPIPIRRAKVRVPRVAGTYLARPALEGRLDRALTAALTVIAAPAGHGKTRTLVEWLAKRPVDAAWLTCSRADEDLTHFAAHLGAALDQAEPGLAPALYRQLVTPNRRFPGELGEAFGDALFDLPRDLVLVIDDFHAADNRATAEFVAGIALAGPARLHVLLSSRRPPSIALSRLRSTGQLAELTADDLRFSHEDTVAVLAQAGVALSPERSAQLHAAVGGWPAAVRLVAVAAEAGADLGGLALLADPPAEQLVLDYLSEEVLAQATPRQRGLLVRAALPERFNASLLAALGADIAPGPHGAEDIQALRALDLFRELPGLDPPWFAYHPLFRRAMLRQLRRELDEAGLAALHRACATWLAADGQVERAVWHLVEAEDVSGAIGLIERNISLAFAREDWRSVASWLGHIPEAWLARQPELVLAAAWVHYLGGRGGRLGSYLEQIGVLRAAGRLSDAQSAEAEVLTVGASITTDGEAQRMRGRLEAALPHLPPANRYRYGFGHAMLCIALGSDGEITEALDRLTRFTIDESAQVDAGSIRGYLGRLIVLWQAGRFPAGVPIAADQLDLASRNHLPVSAAWAELFLGIAAHERGDVTVAAEQFAKVIARADRSHFGCLREAFSRQVVIFERLGNRRDADRALARLRELALAIEAPEHVAVCDSLAARLALFRGDLPAVARWLETAGPAVATTQLLHLENPRITRAMALVALGTPATRSEADRALKELFETAERSHARMALIDLWAITACLRESEGDSAAATDALRRALALAADDHHVTRFTLLPLPLEPILSRLLAEPLPPPEAFALRRLLASPPAEPAGAGRVSRGDPPPTPLTDRERQVLHCLTRALTNQEIGAELFISPITVKHHIEHISDKLGVSGRLGIVMRAVDLGWVAPDDARLRDTP